MLNVSYHAVCRPMVQLANRTSLKHKNLYWWIRNRGFLVFYTSPTPLVVGLFESDPVLRFIIQVLKPFWREESISGDLIHAPKNKSDLWMRICARTQFLNARNPGHQGRGFSIRGGAWHLKICVLTTWVKFRWIFFRRSTLESDSFYCKSAEIWLFNRTLGSSAF